MKPSMLSRWLAIAVFSIVLIGCGDSQEYVFTNTNNTNLPGVPTRQVNLRFDYSQVLAQIPAAVGGYRIEVYSTDGQRLTQQTLSGRVSETALTEVTAQNFVLRVIGLDSAGTTVGFHDLSVPAGVETVTLTIELLLAGQPGTAAYSAPTGQAARLAFLQHPQDVDVDEAFSVAVVALDPAGYRVAGASGAVNLALTGSGALAGSSSANFNSGVASFSGLSVNSAGTDKFLTASATGLTSGQSLGFDVTATGTPQEPLIEVPLDPGASTSQNTPVITTDSNGNFIALWSDVDNNTVVGRRLSPEGAQLGPIFTVSTPASFSYDVAPLPNAGFVAAWSDGASIQVQRFDSSNAPLGTPATVGGSSSRVRVASAGDGSYAVIYNNPLFVLVQPFDPDGVAGTVVNLNGDLADDTLNVTYPDIAMDQAGNFTAVWVKSTATSNGSVVGRQFDSNGSPLDTDFEVALGSVGTSTVAYNPTIAMTSDGRFVVGYEHVGTNDQIRFRVFTSAAVGDSEILVTTTGSESNYAPDIAINQDGSFALSWLRITATENQIWLARFAANGILESTIARAGLSANEESSARVALAPSGALTVVWHSYNGALFNAYYSGFPTGTP